jgi:hypothetical protein
MPGSLKFKMLLIYATEGSSVHVHVIQGTCTGGQLWHFDVVTPLENWSHLEVQGILCFLWAWEVLAAKIHQQLIEVYGTDVMTRQQVAKWCCTFPSGRERAMESNQSG